MTIEDETRKAAVHARQKAEHLEETMLERAEAAIDSNQTGPMAETKRELAAQQRQHEKQRQETLLSRSEEALDAASEPEPDR